MSLLPFACQYTKASGSQQVKATGLTVTADVFRVTLATNAITSLVTSGSAFEIGDGSYGYTYSGTLDFATYYYVAVFHTADTNVQQVDLASAWFDYPQSGRDTNQYIKTDIKAVNDIAIGGSGTSVSPWGPA